MDASVLGCEGWRERERYKYRGHVLRLPLAEILPFGCVALLEGVCLMAHVGFAALFLWAVALAIYRKVVTGFVYQGGSWRWVPPFFSRLTFLKHE